eukprot:Sspe_Gene.14074::Locus_4860_Transcript_1_1_Confidence_1.000_Length_521::g.14074::m.14074
MMASDGAAETISLLQHTAENLRRQLDNAREEAHGHKERSAFLEEKVHELSQLLAQERAKRALMAVCPVRYNDGGLSSPPVESPASPHHQPHCADVPQTPVPCVQSSPARPPSPQSEPSDHLPDRSAWSRFTIAARRFGLQERDLVLVSKGTLRQLVEHCNMD